MADSKISALPASTVPLAGTEVLPIVQSSTTKQVSVANLTAGRAISATQITLTAGNVIPANGYGVDFAATPSTGTSELLADYEEGTWTPTDVSGAGLSLSGSGEYTKIGNMVKAAFSVTYPVTASAAQNFISLPFNSNGGGAMFVGYTTFGSAIVGYVDGTNNRFVIANYSGTALTNAALSTVRIDGVLIYRAS